MPVKQAHPVCFPFNGLNCAKFAAVILTDTHSHLYAEQFDEDRDEAIQRALDGEISRIFLPNIDRSSIAAMHELANGHPDHFFPMMGIHPGSIQTDFEEELAEAEKWLFEHPERYCAVGEIGIDLYWDKTYFRQQQIAFRRQIEWAKQLQKPIVIHARDSFDEIFEILDEVNDNSLTGVFHCFTGSIEQAMRIIAYGGFYVGLGGVSTYKKAGMNAVIPSIPMEKVVLETDSPYLSPTPKRGKRNESAYLRYIAQHVADLYQTSMEQLAEVTTANSYKLFGR